MLEGLEPPIKDALCKVSREASKLSPEDFAILQDALNDKRWTTNALVIALNERGFEVGETALRKHRVGRCHCAR